MGRRARVRRIVYLSRGGDVGGSQRQLLYLLRGLDASYEPVVICTSGGAMVRELAIAGVATEILPLRPWRKLPNAISRYQDARNLARIIARYAPVLVHSSDLWLGNYLASLRRWQAVPLVVHVRGPVTTRDVYKHRLHLADGLISISSRISSALLSAGVAPSRMVQIEDGVDTEAFRLGERAATLSEHAEGSILNVGLVGRIEPAKRQLEFVEAARLAACGLPGRMRFFLVGEARDREYVARATRLVDQSGLRGQLAFTGKRDDMPAVMDSLDVLVSLSGGSVMYEAMSCGVCVVSAGFTRPGDSVHLRDGVTGIVLADGAPSVLAEMLMYLAKNPQVRHRLGSAARGYAEANLSYIPMAAQTIRFYDHILCATPIGLTSER